MILEYVWLDGYSPVPNLRSKIKVKNNVEKAYGMMDAPLWSFDGSSTKQAEGEASDCILVPVREYKSYDGKKIVFCQVYDSANKAHITNKREALNELVNAEEDWWFSFEQEYFLFQNEMPLGWPQPRDDDNDLSVTQIYPRPQGEYYCGVGSNNVVGRQIAEEHLNACLNVGIDIRGINAEVALGQWEYQILGKGIQAADDLWVSRYLLHRIAEKHCVSIDFSPKPIPGDWNGSGMHINFSNDKMRNNGSKSYLYGICDSIGKHHNAQRVASDYGPDNDKRLTGLHETQSIDKFSYGEGDRGASIRIPIKTIDNDYNGYLEDRRPAANADPYRVIHYLMEAIG